MAQIAKNLPAIQETQVQSLGWDNPLEKEMATHSSILAWDIPWTEEPGGLQSRESQESDTTERLHFHFVSRPWLLKLMSIRVHMLKSVFSCSWDKYPEFLDYMVVILNFFREPSHCLP